MWKMIKNAVECAKCGDIIESKHRHDFKFCSCKAIFVDGGLDYQRYGGYAENILDRCEYVEVKDDKDDTRLGGATKTDAKGGLEGQDEGYFGA